MAPGTSNPQTPNIGIVGHSRAGKTVFIASIERALHRHDWKVKIDPVQGRYLQNLIAALKKGQFPQKTLVTNSFRVRFSDGRWLISAGNSLTSDSTRAGVFYVGDQASLEDLRWAAQRIYGNSDVVASAQAAASELPNATADRQVITGGARIRLKDGRWLMSSSDSATNDQNLAGVYTAARDDDVLEMQRAMRRLHGPLDLEPSYELVEISASKGSQQFKLSLVDPAGELFETDGQQLRAHEIEQRRMGRAAMIRNLASCTGFIILLDLEQEGETFTQTVTNFLEQVDISKGKLKRAVVLFSKADLLQWQDRYRVRSAADWVADPRNKVSEMVQVIQSHFIKSRFEFVSTIGWTHGMPNVRTSLTVRPCNQGNQIARARGEHLPDPALPFELYREGIEHSDQFRFMKGLPVFTDPLRLMPYNLPENGSTPEIAGVQFFPGRRQEISAFAPWNVVEPLLWVADDTE